MKINVFVFAIIATFTLTNLALSAEPTPTAITVEDMCCKGCAQKIGAQLYAVRGVKEVLVQLETKTLYVRPQQNVVLSPRALWEAVEKADDQPVKLVGPSGEFMSKPNF